MGGASSIALCGGQCLSLQFLLLGLPGAPPREASVDRISFILANLDKMPPQELATIRQTAPD
ncbi:MULTISPECIES: hypothetical protein [unclassified Microcoleus]|uniref:hypothetical protein n=1 Tax=unclassified Microcoleus TaxID=2642155 RepID=UPI002FD784EC